MTGPSYQMIGKQCRLEKHSIYLRKVSYKRRDGGGGLTGFNLILSAAHSPASIIPLGPWAGQVLSGVMVLIISQGLVCASLSLLPPPSWQVTCVLSAQLLPAQASQWVSGRKSVKNGFLGSADADRSWIFYWNSNPNIPNWLLGSLLITSYSWGCQMLKYLSGLYPNSSKSKR